MNQKERNELSRARILVHASAEFAEHGYYGASVNRICENGKISKGLMYHYYKDRDDLYLACVQTCYSKITELVWQKLYLGSVTVEDFLDSRAAYFEKHPVHYHLYLDSITNICPHIQEQLKQCRSEYDAMSYKIFSAIWENQYKNTVLDPDFAVTMLTIMRRGLNSFIETQKSEDFTPADHAKLCKLVVKTIIRGMISEKIHKIADSAEQKG